MVASEAHGATPNPPIHRGAGHGASAAVDFTFAAVCMSFGTLTALRSTPSESVPCSFQKLWAQLWMLTEALHWVHMKMEWAGVPECRGWWQGLGKSPYDPGLSFPMGLYWEIRLSWIKGSRASAVVRVSLCGMHF